MNYLQRPMEKIIILELLIVCKNHCTNSLSIIRHFWF